MKEVEEKKTMTCDFCGNVFKVINPDKWLRTCPFCFALLADPDTIAVIVKPKKKKTSP